MLAIIRQIGRVTGIALLALLMLGMSTWGTLALVYWDHAGAPLRCTLALACLGRVPRVVRPAAWQLEQD